MEVAKVTSKGQITIPISIRRKLEINEGDKVLFVYKQEGVLMVNPNTYQGGTADIVETTKDETTVKVKAPGTAKEKPAGKASQKNTAQLADMDADDDVYIEVDVINEESEEEEPDTEEAPAVKTAAKDKQVGGLDLSSLLDDIRSIGSNI